jgi:Raf kinase inhibitor-like YbhB/YbcL family protein
MGREEMENGAKHGQNTWGNIGYSGPCPPKGLHHYFFRIYALNKVLDVVAGCTRQELFEAMEDHIIDKNHLIGIYYRD